MAEHYASRIDVEQAAAAWTTGAVECRAYGHNWQPYDAKHVKRLRYWAISQICKRCETIRHQEMSEAGVIFASWYSYVDGYLTEGIGRIAGDVKGAIRIEAIGRTTFREVTGRAKEEDLPRSSHTKAAVLDESVVAKRRIGNGRRAS